MAKAEYIIINAEVMDPGLDLDTRRDVVIGDGKILALSVPEERASFAGACLVDAAGCLVIPGLIDSHGHFDYRGTWNGIPTDLSMIPMGITAIADAGSTGISNYKQLAFNLRNGLLRYKFMLNVSACGIIMAPQISEPIDPSLWNMKFFDEAFKCCGDEIMGLKLRYNRSVVGDQGLTPLRKCVELAERYHTRIIVHVTDSNCLMEDIADLLRPGDVFCHVYHGTGNIILDENGHVLPGIRRARDRGVLFDTATGRGNFSLSVAQHAICDGFLPDMISSDITLQNWHNPIAGTLPYVMSRFLALGMDLKDVIKMTTKTPADLMGLKGAGTLREGTCADITILRRKEEPILYRDRFGHTLQGREQLIPMGTFINGNLLYRSNELTLREG